MAEPTERRLSLSEAARELEVSYSTVRRYRHQGLLRAQWWGGCWTVTREEIAECVERLSDRMEAGRTEC